MKKMKKKISFLTKVFLVIGILFTDLMPLKTVFAYEGTDKFTISVVDNNIVISYLDEIAETDEVEATIVENYIYLDGTLETPVELPKESLLGSELMQDGGVTIASSMLSSVRFDGEYNVNVTLYNVTLDEEIQTVTYSMNKEFEKGFSLKVYDDIDTELTLTNGMYNLNTDIIKFKARLNAGGLSPNTVYVYEDMEYTASELLDMYFSSSKDFTDQIYGEYNVPVSLEIASLDEDGTNLILEENLKVMYKSYEENADMLNSAFDDKYNFESTSKDGTVYVYTEIGKELTVNELVSTIVLVLSEKVTAKFSNSEYEDILLGYDPESGVSPEEFLNNIVLDNSFVMSLTSEDLTVTYKAILVGDVNGDGIVDNGDIESLMKQAVGTLTENSESDLNHDDEIDIMDAAILKNIVDSGAWNVETGVIDGMLEGRLEVNSTDITSGQEFDVNYILTVEEYKLNGFEGIVSYDEEMLELMSITNNTDYFGTNNGGHFIYTGSSSLVGVENVLEDETTSYEKEDYVVLTFKFKALKAGTSTISIENSKFIDGVNEIVLDNYDVSTEVIVNESSDNTLSSLNVAGVNISLEEEVLDYTINVANDVESVDVNAVVNNVAANVSSIVGPEELVEGENIFTVTVTAENGDEKVYTIIVIKEAKEEPEVAEPITYGTYDYNNYEEEPNTPSDNPSVVDEPTAEDKEEKTSNLSRIIIIGLILLVIAGLIYLIFKDEDDEEEKKVNKQVNKLKKEDDFPEIQKETTNVKKENNIKPKNSNNKNSKNNKSKNNKKER